MYQAITAEIKEKVGTITLSREERRNAISPTMMKELLDSFAKYNDDPNVAVIVLTGAGDRAFCSGGDFAESVAVGVSFVERYEEQRQFTEFFKIIIGLKKELNILKIQK